MIRIPLLMFQRRTWFHYFSVVFFSIGSILITALDESGQFRWLGFAAHCVSIGLVFSFWPKSIFKQLGSHPKLVQLMKHWWWVALVMLVAMISRGWWLATYPFVSVGDEVREVGLYTQQIVDGTRRNLFDYGAYQAYSLTISTASALFYLVFGPSVITYRLQAAALGLIDVGIVMMLVWHCTRHKYMTGLAGLTLATLPLHLYYSRTEVVVMYSSTAAALLYFAWVKLRNDVSNTQAVAVFATLVGMSLGLYAAVRTVALLLLLLVGWRILYTTWKASRTKHEFILNLIKKYALLAMFLIVGFGPRLLYTTPAIFFHTSRLPLIQQAQSEASEKLQLVEKYSQSLGVWFSRPTTSWYADHKPIVSPVLAICLVVGIGWVLVRRKGDLVELLGVGLALHATNSAITDMVNADHRLAPLYILGSIMIGIGLGWLVTLPKKQWVQRVVVLMVVGVLLTHGASFFLELPANKNKSLADYVSMHAVYILQQTKINFEKVRIVTSQPTYEKLNTTHYREQYSYFLRGALMTATTSADLAENEIIIETEPKLSNAPRIVFVRCTALTCPVEQQEPLTVVIR